MFMSVCKSAHNWFPYKWKVNLWLLIKSKVNDWEKNKTNEILKKKLQNCPLFKKYGDYKERWENNNKQYNH